jgi:hypothetical protein
LGCSLLLLSIRISNGKASFSSRPSSALTWGESHVPYRGTSQAIRLPRLTAKKGKTWGRCGVFFQGIWPRMRGYVACHISPALADSVLCRATQSPHRHSYALRAGALPTQGWVPFESAPMKEHRRHHTHLHTDFRAWIRLSTA